MRYTCRSKDRPWHAWFAWYPVWAGDTLVWLERVRRKRFDVEGYIIDHYELIS